MKTFIANKKGMKPLTIGIILVALIAIVALLGSNLEFRGSELNVYSGRLKVNVLEVKRLDGSAFGVADSFYRVIHGSGDWNDKVGSYSSDSITGDLKASDNGVWYLCIDYGTNNTQWLDEGETFKDPYVAKIFGRDGDQDGFDETYVELFFGGLGPLKAGEDKKEVEVTLVWDTARTASITYTSLTNASSISTSAYNYYTATGYMGGFSEGEMAKLAKIQIDFSNTNNETYPDNEYWKLVHLQIGPYTFTQSQFGGYDLANKRFEIKFGDQVNHAGGKPLYYAKNAGDLWASYELKAYCKYPSSSKTIIPQVKFYFYKPDGTISSAFTEYVSFAS
jgi:hypothetical protein